MNSYRIRTTPGQDNNILVNITQDFDQLEILSLKIRQSNVYDRMCSDYGVVAGRVYSNNGYGIPNVKLSIFVPIENIDESNPIISTLYPYKSVVDVNEDGFKYNLLPYEPSYNGHTPTGSFPSREDVLTNQSVLEVYEKYYKFSVSTNDSGDFMIFGVPLGDQTLVMNVDLSDIGEFSLTPDDLIRMGIATEDQFDGNKFKSSSNIDELPQIITLYKNITVVPLWGQPDSCQIGITRSDFDLTAEANINIQPTSIFMGSIISTDDEFFVKENCNLKGQFGENCNLITNTGKIIAIRQTIFNDENGDPVLERADLPSGGNLIDGDGTWMFELPMNMDYIYTDEFGQKKISKDPKIGIPSSAKYRFKIKWNQPSIITDGIRRGYYLVPNVREYGWDNNGNLNSLQSVQVQKSYAFSLNWDDYVDKDAAINCEDYFYKFDYNTVYTVSSFIDNHKEGNFRSRFLGIKKVNDRECAQVNKFPVNDAYYYQSFLSVIISILIRFTQLMLYLIIVPAHIVIGIVRLFGWLFSRDIRDAGSNFLAINLAMITYPSCDNCECSVDEVTGFDGNVADSGFMYPFNTWNIYNENFEEIVEREGGNVIRNNLDKEIPYNIIRRLVSGQHQIDDKHPNFTLGVPLWWKDGDTDYWTDDLPLGERINLFNTKAKYYEGLNKISVQIEPESNTDKEHYDTTLTFITYPEVINILSPGDLFTFIDPNSSNDPNISNITGITQVSDEITITYASDIVGERIQNKSESYVIPNPTSYTETYQYPSDIEYYQVITAITMNQFLELSKPKAQVLNNDTTFADITKSKTTIKGQKRRDGPYSFDIPCINIVDDNEDILVYIIQRGVDPYSPKFETKFGLGRIFGYDNDKLSEITVTGQYRINQPIINGGETEEEFVFYHNDDNLHNNSITNGLRLYYQSQFFTPDNVNYSGYTSDLLQYYAMIDNRTVYGGLKYGYSPFNCNLRVRLSTDNTDGTDDFQGTKDLFPNWAGDTDRNAFINQDQGTLNMVENYMPWEDDNGQNKFQYYPDSIVGGTYMYRPKGDNINNRAVYFSSIYNRDSCQNQTTIEMSGSTSLVMRSDRIPSSDTFVEVEGTNNIFLLQQNYNKSLYIIDSVGGGNGITGIPAGDRDNQDDDDYSGNTLYTNTLDTFGCDGMVDLTCYDIVDNNLIVKDDCKRRGVVNNGCYRLVKRILVDIGRDFKTITQWGGRYIFFYRLCQNAISESFTNNWINGVLFMFPIEINITFDNENKAEYNFCGSLIREHVETNNFYYRSSPYSRTSGEFVGDRNGDKKRASNDKNIKSPTTILNLGPKESFLFDLTLNDKYLGYLGNNLNPTTYQNNGDIVNLFVISRFQSLKFIKSLYSPLGNSFKYLFERYADGKLSNAGRVDGDFAQSIATHSQIGVSYFSANNYNTSGDTAEVYLFGDPKDEGYFGIFFRVNDEYSNIRSLISNKEVILNSNVSRDININDQLVPMYSWDIKDDEEIIFGNDKNNWDTENITTIGYQSLDTSNQNVYFIPNIGDTTNLYNLKGYIYSQNSDGTFNLSDSGLENPVIFGSPWYFYFGLNKGRTVYDRFLTKYVFDSTLNE